MDVAQAVHVNVKSTRKITRNNVKNKHPLPTTKGRSVMGVCFVGLTSNRIAVIVQINVVLDFDGIGKQGPVDL